MKLKTIADKIKADEGFSSHPYTCTEGYLTIGYGRNLDTKGISEYEAEMMLMSDIADTTNRLKGVIKSWFHLPDTIQYVLINMGFQMGIIGLLGFKNMLKAIEDQDWERMIIEMKDSRWYHQTTNRADRLIEEVRNVQDS